MIAGTKVKITALNMPNSTGKIGVIAERSGDLYRVVFKTERGMFADVGPEYPQIIEYFGWFAAEDFVALGGWEEVE